ncbi:hypothetical protein [Rhizobium phaseoli]|uniref:hypothetical protein n=1 Tax=Rhizobium phaseoli TaxID=396 RepID=UPI0007F135CD|nr:hypothetical protein [Rhizobium phaseoli]ANL33950.1 hypothetical protein AMC89_CH01877 [Rhizobium phaseoli]ANL97675.1 hypothetical protein AMC79_CH01872 [Rhizobium phaseoli]
MSHKVEVWGEKVEVAVYQKSKSVWIAVGTYKGETVEVKRSTRGAALLGWKDAARYRGN